jgi:hypothetical protein
MEGEHRNLDRNSENDKEKKGSYNIYSEKKRKKK